MIGKPSLKQPLMPSIENYGFSETIKLANFDRLT